MNIAVFFELNSGGARRASNSFAKAMKILGHKVDLYYVSESPLPASEASSYSSLIRTEFHPVKWEGNDWSSRLYRDTIELIHLRSIHKRIATIIQNQKYDGVIVHPSKYTQAPWILRFLSLPTLYYCQEPLRLVYDPEIASIPKHISFAKQCYERTIRLLRKGIDRYNISAATTILANSHFTKERIKKSYGLSSTVCHMGVDTSIFFPKDKKSVDVLFIGAEEESDGYDLFKKSMPLLKKKKPRIKIRSIIRGKNWTSNDQELRKAYSTARIVLCLAFNEPFGLIAIEAMACGAVVVALDEGGYRDSVVQKRTGIRVNRDAKQIASSCHYLLGHPTVLKTCAKQSVATVHSYWTWERGAQTMMKLFQK
jgi:glycosyltransferase involved in cell wall biosynthesis